MDWLMGQVRVITPVVMNMRDHGTETLDTDSVSIPIAMEIHILVNTSMVYLKMIMLK